MIILKQSYLVLDGSTKPMMKLKNVKILWPNWSKEQKESRDGGTKMNGQCNSLEKNATTRENSHSRLHSCLVSNRLRWIWKS